MPIFLLLLGGGVLVYLAGRKDDAPEYGSNDPGVIDGPLPPAPRAMPPAENPDEVVWRLPQFAPIGGEAAPLKNTLAALHKGASDLFKASGYDCPDCGE